MNTVDSHYSELRGTREISLFITKQRKSEIRDHQNDLVIMKVCYISACYNENPLYWRKLTNGGTFPKARIAAFLQESCDNRSPFAVFYLTYWLPNVLAERKETGGMELRKVICDWFFDIHFIITFCSTTLGQASAFVAPWYFRSLETVNFMSYFMCELSIDTRANYWFCSCLGNLLSETVDSSHLGQFALAHHWTC